MMSIDAIRYSRLGYVALNVTDIERSIAFYRDQVGLTLTGRGIGGCAYLRCSERHHDIMLLSGSEPGLKRVGWEMESDEALSAVREHLESLGIKAEAVTADECSDLGISPAFRATEPTTGAKFEFYSKMEVIGPWEPTHTKIAQLGHVVLRSADRLATEAFMADHLNFRISDRIDGQVTFMRCFPNPFHHSYGVGAGEVSKFHHVNFMVSEIDDIGKGNVRMKQAGAPIVYGPGRHPPSDSIFLYFLDPDGLTLEYSFGMEEFPESDPRAPRDMPAILESIDYWGGRPEPDFTKAGVIET